MSTLQIVETVIESLAIIATIVALFNDEKIYQWEQKLKARWKR